MKDKLAANRLRGEFVSIKEVLSERSEKTKSSSKKLLDDNVVGYLNHRAVCEARAGECERTADGNDFMQRCADACRRCAESCRRTASETVMSASM